MNLYFRLFWTVLKALRAPHLPVGEAIEMRMRTLPTDLDVNGHMNNARYLSLVDLALVTLFIRTGFARLCFQQRWRPMAGGSISYFRRGFDVFQAFTLRFTPLGWDEYWTYSRFEFVRHGKLHTVGFTKGAAVGADGMIPTSRFLPKLGVHGDSPPLPADLLAWIAADRALGDYVKSQMS